MLKVLILVVFEASVFIYLSSISFYWFSSIDRKAEHTMLDFINIIEQAPYAINIESNKGENYFCKKTIYKFNNNLTADNCTDIYNISDNYTCEEGKNFLIYNGCIFNPFRAYLSS